MKKYILGTLVALSLPIALAFAATPVLSVLGAGDQNNVTVNVSGADPNSPVTLFFNSSTLGTQQSATIGTTDANGAFSGTVSTLGRNINSNTPVFVMVNGYVSNNITWPYNSSGVTTSTSTITFSPNAPVLAIGQNGTVTISGSNGSYYISSNSNSSGLNASINGSTLSLTPTSAGTSVVTVCSTSNSCFPLTVSTTGSGSGTTINQSTLNLSGGQAGTISISGIAPYTATITSGNGVSTSLTGNTLTVYGNATGTTMLNVCSSNGSCTPLTVNVNSTGVMTSSGYVMATIPLMVGQTMMIPLSGGNGNYSLQAAMSTPVAATVSGNILTVTGIALGPSTVTVCSNGTMCTPMMFSVNSTGGTGGGWLFESNLSVGMTSQDVMELQNRLRDEGFFTATSTGYFGPLTMAAVQAYQSAHGISSTGYVGSITRAELNK